MAGQTPEALRALRRKHGLGEFAGRAAVDTSTGNKRGRGKKLAKEPPRPRRRVLRRAVGVRGGLLLNAERPILPDSSETLTERNEAALKAMAERSNPAPLAGFIYNP